MNKYMKNIHTKQHYVVTHEGEKQWSKPSRCGLSVKGRKPTPTCARDPGSTKNKEQQQKFSLVHFINR